MNKALLTLPITMALILGAATQLQEIAESSADKAIEFSDDMNSAMDCATKGIPIRVCSPELLEYDFDDEKESLEAVLEELQPNEEISPPEDAKAH